MRQKPKTEELQSSMEYLMTYGWTILIVAVMLAVLFSTGIFGGAQTLPFVCMSTPGFLCSNPSMGSGGALTIKFGYMGPSQIKITGLVCNITSSTHPPSYETTNIMVSPNQQLNLTFQCPMPAQTRLGTSIPVLLWIYYDTQSQSGLQMLYAKGSVRVDYISLLWNVAEWTPSSSNVNLVPYSWVTSNPETPPNTRQITTTTWSSLIANGQEGWSYSTDWHNHDIYYGIETTPFPLSPLNLDNAICDDDGPPYDAHAYTATTYASMSGTYTFSIVTDDATQIFYRPASGGAWQSVFPFSSCKSLTTPHRGVWCGQPPYDYAQMVNFPAGKYELVVDYMDTCDPASLSVVLISPPPTPA